MQYDVQQTKPLSFVFKVFLKLISCLKIIVFWKSRGGIKVNAKFCTGKLNKQSVVYLVLLTNLEILNEFTA